MEKAVEKLTAEHALQMGVPMKLRAPFLFRLCGIKTIKVKIYSPVIGTLMRVSRYYLSTGIQFGELKGLSMEKAIELHAMHGTVIRRAVASSILNGAISGKLLTRPLSWYLKWHSTPKEMLQVVEMVLLFGGTSDFINTTKSIRFMKMTDPRTGPTDQGS